MDYKGFPRSGQAPRGHRTALDRLVTNAETRAILTRRVESMGRDAYAAQGLRAFGAARRTAAIHESGHCVTHAAVGDCVRRAAIWKIDPASVDAPIAAAGELVFWGGETLAGRAWGTGPETSPEDDLDHAMTTIAGLAAEIMFDAEDFRAGSSLDEVAVLQGLCSNVAHKTNARFVTGKRR